MKKNLSLVLIICLLSIGLFYFLHQPAEAEKTKEVQIEVLDIGQGDAILIRTSKENVLIDTGDVYRSNPAKGGTDKSIVELLKKRNIKTIDKIFITHPHADHLGGIVPIMENFQVKAIYDNGEIASSKVYRDFLKEQKLSKNKAATYAHINNETNNYFDFGNDVTFKVLSPAPSMIEKGNKEKDKQFNNNSIVGQLKYGKFSMLFTGDAEKETEEYLVNKYSDQLSSTVLKVGHHGSASSSTSNFIKKVHPEYAVISCGADSRYHHPHLQTLKTLENNNVQIFATNGNNKFKGGDNGNTIVIIPQKNGKVSISKIKE